MKVLVCGGRAYADHAKVFAALDAVANLRPISLIVEGGSVGADAMARDWAAVRRVKAKSYPAVAVTDDEPVWSVRNQQMLDESAPDLVIGFPGGRRTADMLRRAKAVGTTTLELAP
jgi:hypothetical protein